MPRLLTRLDLLIILLATHGVTRFALAAATAGSPVCDTNDGSCGMGRRNRNKATTRQQVAGDTTDFSYDDSEDNDTGCALYLAESAAHPGKLGIFSGIRVSKDEPIGEPEIVLPILDARKNEWSPWHDMVLDADTFPQLLQESYYQNDAFVPGIGAIAACSKRYSNVNPSMNDAKYDTLGVHRSKDFTAGSFSYYHDFTYEATKDLLPGEELLLPCPDDDDDEEEYNSGRRYYKNAGRKVLSVDFLKEAGMCIDNLRVGKSTIDGAGRGAFAKRQLQVGDVISYSPVLHFDKSQMEIVQQQLYPDDHWLKPESRRSHGIMYSEHTVGQQLMLNYCYGEGTSNVLLLPYAPMVNYINHNTVRGKANAYIRWTNIHEDILLPGTDAKYMKSQRPMELFSIPARGDTDETLMIEFVAMRTIEPGEEIFLMMDDEYMEAWEEHEEKWKSSTTKDEPYVSALEFKSEHPGDSIRTQEEQASTPYPETIQTYCYFAGDDYDEDELEELDTIEWDESNVFECCLRPCDIIEREGSGDEATYTAKVLPMERFEEPDCCNVDLPENGIVVENIPATAVRLMDKPYTTDLHQHDIVFRKDMSLPHKFYPEAWASADPNPDGDFIPQPLEAGEMDRIRWIDNSEIVLQNCFRLGLDPKVRETLTEYCEKMKIIEIFRHFTVADNSLKAGQETSLKIKGYNWFMQRPESNWHSNLHWLSPADMESHKHYLQALSAGGFSSMLKSIGEFLGLDHLVVFHVTFIATSQSTRGYIHTDVSNTGVRTFNVIVPLKKAKNSPPELDIQEDAEDGRIGRYPYEIDVGVLNGDDSWHGTSAVDYRLEKDMRLAATIYIAEVTPENVDSIMADYTQKFPPDDKDLLLSWAGRHWNHNDPDAMLPPPGNDHVLLAKE